MLPTVAAAISKYHMLSAGDRVVIGLSGGADSVLLFTLLLELRASYALELAAAHINHGIRGAEADSDEVFVKQLCESHGVRFYAFHECVPALAAEQGISEEEAGRRVRYGCFYRAADDFGAQKIALAHNKNDNAETVLMRLFRGTGPAGLCGIPPVRGRIIRPLIETERSGIEAYLNSHGIPFCTDSTNFSMDYTRNRIRRQIIPAIEQALAVNTADKLWELSRLCAEEADFVNAEAQKAFDACLIQSDADSLLLSVGRLTAFRPAIVSGVLRLAAAHWSLRDVSLTHISAIKRLLNSGHGLQTQLPGPLTVSRDGDILQFSRHSPGPAAGFCCGVAQGEPTFVRPLNAYYLVCAANSDITKPIAPAQKLLLNGGATGLQIRSRLPGDWIKLRHIGRVKLKDYFINRKTPRTQRDRIGLLARGSEILWIMDDKSLVNENCEPNGSNANVYVYTWRADTNERDSQHADNG